MTKQAEETATALADAAGRTARLLRRASSPPKPGNHRAGRPLPEEGAAVAACAKGRLLMSAMDERTRSSAAPSAQRP